MLQIPWTAYRINASILKELNIRENRRLLITIQRQILTFFEHIIRRGDPEQIIVQGKLQGKRGKGHAPTSFIDQIKNLTGIWSITEIMLKLENRSLEKHQ